MGRPGKRPHYVFDASAWIDANERAGDNRIPVLLNRLHDAKRIHSPKQVFKELERPGLLTDWIEERRQKLTAPRGLPNAYSRKVGEIQWRYPGMGRALGAKERGDPYVVALAAANSSDDVPWIVVCAETLKNRPRRKIPGVCADLGVRCITLAELIELELPDDEAAE